MQRSNSHIGNYILLLGSLVITFLLIEVFVIRTALPLTPLRFHDYLGDFYTLAQSSKAKLEPRDYIALVGDSYAQGSGDWLRSADPNTNGPFHSAHVINERTGRDVVTFGKGGAGSIDGIMVNPIRNFSRINSSWLYSLERPKTIIVYFYEGNDLNDNLRTIRKYVRADAGDGGMELDRKLEVLLDKQYNKAASSTDILNNVAAIKFLIRLTRDIAKDVANGRRGGETRKANVQRHPKPKVSTNRIRVAGAVHLVPGALQSPAMELNENEMRVAVQSFEHALVRLHRFFPDARLFVTIIPSPLTVYELASDTVMIQTYEGGTAVYPSAEVQQKSNQICEMILTASQSAGAEFIDIRGMIRALARRKLIHGPKDWKHFNKEGYVELGNVLSNYLENPSRPLVSCDLR